MRPARLIAAVFLVLALGGCGDEDEPVSGVTGNAVEVQDASWKDGPSTNSRERMACTAADEPANFTVYWLGPRFADLPLTAILRRCDKPYPGEPIRANSVSFIYGTCEIPPEQTDGGCAPPLQVETSPACERPASGDPSEIVAGRSIVVVDALRDLKQRAIEELAAVPEDIPPAGIASFPAAERPGELPPPAPGALDGGLSCKT